MTKKTYYTLILDTPAREIESAVFKIDALRSYLIETNELCKTSANGSADVDFKETQTPERPDDRFLRAFAKRHPEALRGLDVAAISFYRFRAHAKNQPPLMQNFLVSLNAAARFLVIENGVGELVSLEKLLAEHAPTKKGLSVLDGKSLEELSRMKDLHEIFQRAKITQPQNRCIEDLLMSDAAHHWRQAVEQINAEESVSDVIEALISIYESTKDLSIQRALLGAIHRVTAMSVGKMEEVPALSSQKVAEYEGRGKGVILQFLGSRYASIGHSDLFGAIRSLTQ